MTVSMVERSLIHAQLELKRHDAQALDEAHGWLVRALIELEAVRHPGATALAEDPVAAALGRSLKTKAGGG